MSDRNTSHLAGEFLVAGELSRRGYPVSITMGNAKSIDIYVETKTGSVFVDAKAGKAKGNWPITEENVRRGAEKGLYYIFVYLQTAKRIEKDNTPPEYFIVKSDEIIKKDLIKTWKTRQGITYKDLNNNSFKNRWDKLPPSP